MTATAAAHGTSANTPLKIRNSPTNPLRPGKPSEANTANPISEHNTGTCARSPPKSASVRAPPLRCSISPMQKKIVLAMIPWLNACKIVPEIAAACALRSVFSAAAATTAIAQ